MTYQHRFVDGAVYPHALGKIVCVGRNYAEHAQELNNPIPTEPLLFIKPATAAVDMREQLHIPQGLGACHHELEVAILIGSTLRHASLDEAYAAIAGIGLGIDLTLRDLQQQLKTQGHPWERAKSFDGANPLSPFVPYVPAANNREELQSLDFSLQVNGVARQRGNTRDMLFPIVPLLAHISQWFTLQPGDVVMTGTPAGVSALMSGDTLLATLADGVRVSSAVC